MSDAAPDAARLRRHPILSPPPPPLRRWYEGAGLVRHVWITSFSAAARVATHSVFAPAAVTGAVHARATTAAGVWADGASLEASFSAQSAPGAPASTAVATFALFDASGATVATATVPGVAVPADGGAVQVAANLSFANAELWSIPRPYLYTLSTSLSVGGATVDAVNTSVGVRALSWDADTGLAVNTQPVKLRGFCNHESFAGVGAALADRIDLLRIQQVRGVGGNAWRTSHNAPEPVLLALADILGIAVMDGAWGWRWQQQWQRRRVWRRCERPAAPADPHSSPRAENRVFATEQNCPGCPQVPNWPYGGQVQNFRDLIRRDKNHPSVFWWSACNEAGCGNGNGTLATYFRQAVYEEDGSRGFGGKKIAWHGREGGGVLAPPLLPSPPPGCLPPQPTWAGSRPSRRRPCRPSSTSWGSRTPARAPSPAVRRPARHHMCGCAPGLTRHPAAPLPPRRPLRQARAAARHVRVLLVRDAARRGRRPAA